MSEEHCSECDEMMQMVCVPCMSEIHEEESTKIEKLRKALKLYGGHRNDGVMMCERLKHSEFQCNCGWSEYES